MESLAVRIDEAVLGVAPRLCEIPLEPLGSGSIARESSRLFSSSSLEITLLVTKESLSSSVKIIDSSLF